MPTTFSIDQAGGSGRKKNIVTIERTIMRELDTCGDCKFPNSWYLLLAISIWGLSPLLLQPDRPANAFCFCLLKPMSFSDTLLSPKGTAEFWGLVSRKRQETTWLSHASPHFIAFSRNGIPCDLPCPSRRPWAPPALPWPWPVPLALMLADLRGWYSENRVDLQF